MLIGRRIVGWKWFTTERRVETEATVSRYGPHTLPRSYHTRTSFAAEADHHGTCGCKWPLLLARSDALHSGGNVKMRSVIVEWSDPKIYNVDVRCHTVVFAASCLCFGSNLHTTASRSRPLRT